MRLRFDGLSSTRVIAVLLAVGFAVTPLFFAGAGADDATEGKDVATGVADAKDVKLGQVSAGGTGTVNPAAPAGGNLAVIDLKAYQVTASGLEHRYLVRALVENQTPVSREGNWALVVRRTKSKTTLGSCRGAALPQGRVAVCEVWVEGKDLQENDVIEAQLDRTVGDFNVWDHQAGDDRQTTLLRTLPERGNVLRIATWKVFPALLQSPRDVDFEFTAEGAHLCWLLNGDNPPRLLAGHPADGVLTGRGRDRVKTSGPFTIVARNSLGAFVYQIIPMINSNAPPKQTWTAVEEQKAEGAAIANILDAGVYDVDEDSVILENLSARIKNKDWAAEVERMRQRGTGGMLPHPANALNPRARDQR